jgi:hypothetical protein
MRSNWSFLQVFPGFRRRKRQTGGPERAHQINSMTDRPVLDATRAVEAPQIRGRFPYGFQMDRTKTQIQVAGEWESPSGTRAARYVPYFPVDKPWYVACTRQEVATGSGVFTMLSPLAAADGMAEGEDGK